MAKDDNGGLLSKVVRFVRNPTTNWADLDQQDGDRDSSYSKQMLKEMIERKRRNDFVRKREFDMLRKMRRREVMVGQDPGARPSFFQSSMASKPDGRAMTLKKIDEIEEQMSMQWWKTKHGESSSQNSDFQAGADDANSSGAGPVSTQQPPRVQKGFEATEPASLEMLKKIDATMSTPGFAAQEAIASDFVPSDAGQAEEVEHDPELEEAAIRFANGDHVAAESSLLEATGQGGSRNLHVETWLTLLDLYRATGQDEKFEQTAGDFSNKFGRAAPVWKREADVVTSASPLQSNTPKREVKAGAADWIAPEVLSLSAVNDLESTLNRAALPWKIDWNDLRSMDEDGAEELTQIFGGWASRPVRVLFVGGDNLLAIVKGLTTPPDKSVAQVWWRLRMAVLRVLNYADEFELVALNYCVTYEVSPPSWDGPLCDCRNVEGDEVESESLLMVGEVFRNSLQDSSQFPNTTSNPQLTQIATVELAGQIVGDASIALSTLSEKLGESDVMVISCANLQRVDFSAAGTLLNWVAARHAEGRKVRFDNVNRLIAAFLNVIGINEFAKVSIRPD